MRPDDSLKFSVEKRALCCASCCGRGDGAPGAAAGSPRLSLQSPPRSRFLTHHISGGRWVVLVQRAWHPQAGAHALRGAPKAYCVQASCAPKAYCVQAPCACPLISTFMPTIALLPSSLPQALAANWPLARTCPASDRRPFHGVRFCGWILASYEAIGRF